MMISHSYSNSTQFGIKNDVERFIWAGWLILIFSASILGNTIILVASIQFKAFKLHGVIVTFIQHIASCDLIISIFLVLSQSVSLFANMDEWFLGTATCYFRAYMSPFCNSVSLFLVCGMTVSKLLLLKHPLKARTWSRKHAHMCIACLWTLSLYSPIMAFSVDINDVYYDSRIYTCFIGFSSTAWKFLLPISVVLLTIIPTIVTIVTSALLIKHLIYARKVAKRTHGFVPWQGIVTVVLSATVYCVSFLPASAYLAARPYLESETGDENVQYFFRVGDTFKYFNVAANFFIYCLAVISFRDFLKKRIQALIRNVTCTTSASYIGTRDLASETIIRNPGACDILQTDV